MTKTPQRWLLGFALSVAASAAYGHAGDTTDSLMAGLVHPFGVDHLLAALAVGLWCAHASAPRGRGLACAIFLGGLLCGAVAGAFHAAPALSEMALGASVAVFGALLVAPRALPRPVALAVLTGAAALHGAFHGAAGALTPAFGLYVAGLVVATLVSLAAGLALGTALQRVHRWAWRAAAAAIGAAGLVLMALA